MERVSRGPRTSRATKESALYVFGDDDDDRTESSGSEGPVRTKRSKIVFAPGRDSNGRVRNELYDFNF